MLTSKNRGVAAHTDPKQIGMGDWYGSGIKQKIGKIRDTYSILPIPKETKTLPKKLA
jgi:hypothetical protein